jgi:hypothetical protein
MDESTLTAEVADLRAAGLTPKEIARRLGVRPAMVEPIVRALARAVPAVEAAVAGCWVSPGWSSRLRVETRPGWRDDLAACSDDMPPLVQVVVARERRYGKVSVCLYLVDTQCLGVKNARGPRSIDRADLAEFVASSFAPHGCDPLPAPLELAQDLVLGAVLRARRLGFEPHPDFAACRNHLGSWTGPGAIDFDAGRPLYVQGPADDARAIVRTLERTVGRGHFDAVLVSDVT